MSDIEPPEPPNLRFLRILVTVLTAVMIAGLIAVVATFVIRLPGAMIRAPEALELPPGTEILAVTQTPAYWIVTTRDDRVLIFDTDGGFREALVLGR
ncbi:DUF6476 family protein [Jannaschia ovalis]|uniref:DUF6476 family protein n=1 Tax=Jannaschia ovalis TaxID=3038773 RepID=A0ABY8L8K0_9RHOB|nr:DUF6476 family protein [Jannaschia sp. GRR-S6-38]WGH77599.1 DUF6476 family protein [Jannaschia sp. GRR-S6-38]